MAPRLTVAMFGSSLVSAYWNGAATYYRGLLKALHAVGVETTFYEPDAYDRQAHRDLDDPPWATSVVYPATQDAVEAMLERARRADLVVKTSGVGVFDALLEKAVPDVAPGRAVFWDVDAPATLARVRNDPADSFRSLIPRYSTILTYGGGPPVIEAYRALGARACVPIYNAVDPDTHHPAPPEARFRADVGLLANRLPDREARIEAFFLGPAARLPTRSFVLGGNGWQDRELPPNVRAVGHVFTPQHNAFNASADVVLNVNRADMAAVGYSPATRIFEAAGAGACLLTDRWEGLEQFLDPDREVLVAGDGDEVIAILDALTDDDRRRIGEAARRRVLAEHTYAHRVQAVLDALDVHVAPGVRQRGIAS